MTTFSGADTSYHQPWTGSIHQGQHVPRDFRGVRVHGRADHQGGTGVGHRDPGAASDRAGRQAGGRGGRAQQRSAPAGSRHRLEPGGSTRRWARISPPAAAAPRNRWNCYAACGPRRVVDFHGRYHNVTNAGINPLPVQRPIPLWMGAGSRARGPIPPDRVLSRVGQVRGRLVPAVRCRPPRGRSHHRQGAAGCRGGRSGSRCHRDGAARQLHRRRSRVLAGAGRDVAGHGRDALLHQYHVRRPGHAGRAHQRHPRVPERSSTGSDESGFRLSRGITDLVTDGRFTFEQLR